MLSSLFLSFCLLATQVVVFDFGGVLTGEPNREEVVQFLQQSFALTRDEFEKINQEKKLALKQGQTDAEFWLGYAQRERIELPVNWIKSFHSSMIATLRVNREMYLLVEELREQNIPVAMLSNIDARLATFVREAGLYEPFNPCLLSYELGCEKPHPQIYEMLLSQLNVAAQEIVFIDDREENVDAAKKMGIDAILFKSEEGLRKELAARGISIPLPGQPKSYRDRAE